MFKYFSTVFLFFLSYSIVAQELTATQKIPANATPGTDITIETTVNRGSVTGFMKFFQEIPEGCTATDIDSKGGSFTFADNGAKIVWIAPPTETTFTVSYKLTIPASISGAKTFGGKISYISNNERKVFDFEPKTITIGSAVAVAEKKETPKVVTPTPTTTPVTTPATTPVVTKSPETSTPAATATPIAKTEPAPVKKETPAPSQPATTPTFTKIPTSALPTSTGKIYKVQIGAYAAKPKIEGVPQLSTFVLDNGITKYFSGSFSTYEEALKRKKEMLDKGFQGAFIVAFEGGKIVK